MNTRSFLIPALSLFAMVSVSADIVMVSETDSAAGKTRSTMSIKGSMIRADNGKESSVIMNTESGEMTTLMHEGKMMVKMNTKDLAAAAASTLGATDGKVEAAKLVKTGKSEKVGAYECDIYTMEMMGTTSKLWIARDYPDYAKLKKQLETVTKMMSPGTKQPEMPGLAVKTETVVSGATFTSTVVSLKEEKVQESIFTMPTGYKSLGG